MMIKEKVFAIKIENLAIVKKKLYIYIYIKIKRNQIYTHTQ